MRIPTLWVERPFVVPAWGATEAGRAFATLILPRTRERELVERDLRRLTAREHGMATASGRLAIDLALRAASIGQGDEVVIPTFACAAIVSAVRQAGASPRFADVGSELNLTVDAFQQASTDRTRAVIVVHAGGRRAPVEGIAATARGRGITVIEDCAQAMGGESGAVPWGNAGDYAIWSFGMGKNVMASAGGFVAGPRNVGLGPLEAEPRRAAAARLLRVLLAFRWRRWTRPFVIALGMRSRGAPEDRDDAYPRAAMSEMDAAILRVQLIKLTRILEARRRNALAIIEELGGDDRIDLPDPQDHVFTKFYIRLRHVTRPAGGGRSAEVIRLVRGLLRAGFETELPYTPLHLRYGGGPCPVADDVWWRTLTLPVRPGLTATDCRRLARAVRDQLPRD